MRRSASFSFLIGLVSAVMGVWVGSLLLAQSKRSSTGSYVCRHIGEEEAVVDGKLTEAAWGRAQALSKFVVPPTKKLATFQTRAKLLWSDTNLYFGAEMEDGDIYGLHEGHDSPFGGDDVIELFVKPSRKKPAYWEFHVTPRGATRDWFYARRNAGPDERWKPYESGMKAAVSLQGTLNEWEDRDKRWTVEAAIPFRAFEDMGGKPKHGTKWNFIVTRYDYSVHLDEGLQLSSCFPLSKVNFHLHEEYGILVFE